MDQQGLGPSVPKLACPNPNPGATKNHDIRTLTCHQWSRVSRRIGKSHYAFGVISELWTNALHQNTPKEDLHPLSPVRTRRRRDRGRQQTEQSCSKDQQRL